MNTYQAASLKSPLKVALIMAAATLLSALSMPANGATTSNTYDALNRLTKTDFGNGLVINYTYDAAGNRLTQVITTVSAVPEIAVEHPVGINFSDGGETVDFGSINTGNASTLKTITIRNTGTADLSGLAVSLSGANASDFVMGSLGTTTLAPGANTTFTVTFTPAAAGSRSAALQIASNDANENPFDITLGGTGVAPLPNDTFTSAIIATGNSYSISTTNRGATLEQMEPTPSGSINVGASIWFEWASPVNGTVRVNTLGSDFDTVLTVWKGSSLGNLTEIETNDDTDGNLASALTFEAESGVAYRIAVYGYDRGVGNVSLQILVTNPYDIAFVGTPYELRIGNQVTFDLKRLLAAGETVKVSGRLPTGLKFNATTGMLTGTLSGKPGVYQASVQILQGRTVVRTVLLPITVLAFPSSLIGNFDCLLEDFGGLPYGAFHLSITGSNAWTATLESVGAAKRSARGTFILAPGAPIAPITAVFPATTGASAVTINLPLDGTSPLIAATYNGGTVRGFRVATGAENPPSSVSCNIVFLQFYQDGIDMPDGIGWASGTVSKLGTGTFKGLLGDGTTVSFSLRLSATGQAVLWAQPYTNKNSYIGGIITMPYLGQLTVSDQPLEDHVCWAKAADAKTLSYPNGFPALEVDVGSSRWVTPATATELGASLGWLDNRTCGAFIWGGGLNNYDSQGTSAALPTQFTINDAFSLVTSAPSTSPLVLWSGKANKTNGTFSGTFTIPTGFSTEVLSGSAAGSGVLVQDEALGTLTGFGLIKVPISGIRGSFRTASFYLDQGP